MNVYYHLLEEHQQLNRETYQYWLQNNLFHFDWWLLLIVMFISWFLLWKLLDRSRLLELLLVGAFFSIVSTFLDVVGEAFNLWDYPVRLLPVIPPFFIFDFVQVPVAYILIYQYFHKWKSYIIALIVLALCFGYLMESFIEWLGIYHVTNWKHTYSFVLYIVMGLGIKWIVTIILTVGKKYAP